MGLIIALPNFYLYNLCSLPKAAGRYKCEKGSEEYFEKTYMIALDRKKNEKYVKEFPREFFLFSFLFRYSICGDDCSVHSNYMENVSK